MDIAIIALALLAFAHFIYEGIIAPSVRMKLRNKMFGLRDDLRHLHVSSEKCSREAFEIAHSGINQYINRLHGITIAFVSRFKTAYRNNPSLRDEVERRKRVLDACSSPELQGIITRANQNIEFALLINMGMWFLYLVPVAVAASCITAVTAKIHRFVYRLFATSEASTEKLMPDTMRFA